MRPAFLLLGLALGALAGPGPAAAEEKGRGGPDTWFARTITQGDSGLVVRNIWSKGRKLRGEMIADGILLLTLVNGDTYYNLIPSAGTGVAIQRSPKAIAEDQKGGRPFGNDVARILARGAEKASSERVMGREVSVYRLNEGNTREEVWATTDAQQLPIKVSFTDRAQGKTYETKLDWNSAVPLADGFFEPDPRIALQRMTYEEFVAAVKGGKLASFPPLFTDLLLGP